MNSVADFPLPVTQEHKPPFLLWPVSRREFFGAIWVAMVPALAWGILIFGVRPLEMLLSAVVAATFMHVLLKRVIKWRRAQALVYAHSLLGAIVLVALALPTWPAWIITVSALLLPLLYALVGGPGRERVHIAVVIALAIEFIALPAMDGRVYSGMPDAILARDRLLMGDIRDQYRGTEAREWPESRDIGGNDAKPARLPAAVAAETFDAVSGVIVSQGRHGGSLTSKREADVSAIFNGAIASQLPTIDLFMLGVAPNRIGAASLIGITIAGLFLAYRYILRPRSLLLFLVVYILALLPQMFSPAAWQQGNPLLLWHAVTRFPGEFLTVFQFLLWNSDAPLAAVLILALPGTEPLSPRGRRMFLILAAIGAATLHRLNPEAPTATLCLCLLMPFAPLFDRFFARRSWLSART